MLRNQSSVIFPGWARAWHARVSHSARSLSTLHDRVSPLSSFKTFLRYSGGETRLEHARVLMGNTTVLTLISCIRGLTSISLNAGYHTDVESHINDSCAPPIFLLVVFFLYFSFFSFLELHLCSLLLVGCEPYGNKEPTFWERPHQSAR